MKLNTHPENRKDMVKAISELIELPSAYMGMPSAAFQIGSITVSRDGSIDCEDETMIETIKPMINLGDSSYADYSSMVEANELRAASVIEKLAVSLFLDNTDPKFSFYPVQKRYEKLPLEEQAKSRPFQIILTAGGMKTGIVFSVSSDVGRYYRMFIQDEYDVDRLIIVRLIDPDEEAYDTIIARTNQVISF